MAELVEQEKERRRYAFLGRTRYRRVVVCPMLALGTLLPAKGDAMPEAYGGSTSAILLTHDTKPTKESGDGWTVLTYELLEPSTDPGLSIPSDWTVAPNARQVHLLVTRGVQHREVLEIPNGTTYSTVLESLAMGTAYPGETGIWQSRLDDIRIREDSRPGKAALTLVFNPPSIRRALEENPDHARLLADVSDEAVRVHKDLDDHLVWAEHWEAVDSTYEGRRWRPATGAGVQHKSRTLLRLQMAASNGILSTILHLHDSLNEGAMFGGTCAPGTLRMAGAHIEQVISDQSLMYVDALMEYNVGGWNNETTVQAYHYKVYRLPVYDNAGDVIADRYRMVGNWEPYGVPYVTRLYELKPWSTLERTLVWT